MQAKLIIGQGAVGYRYNRDSFLLADFARPTISSQIIDLGGGAGAASIPMGFHNRSATITALEIDEGYGCQAMLNARESGLSNYRVVIGDIANAPHMFGTNAFDLAICNPPYKKRGSGRLNEDYRKAIARHEIKITLGAIVQACSKILKPGGALTLTMAYERRNEYMALLKANDFCETRYRLVLPTAGSTPNIFLSEARLTANEICERVPDLILRSAHGGDSDEYKLISSRYE